MKLMTKSWDPTSSKPEITKLKCHKRGPRAMFFGLKRNAGGLYSFTEERRRPSDGYDPPSTSLHHRSNLEMITV